MAEIKHQIDIQATPGKVYEALATEAGLRGWWTADATLDGVPGGRAELGFFERRTVFHMSIEKLEPEKRIEWLCLGGHPEWEGTVLTWVLSPGKDATTVRLTHSRWREISDFCASCNSTWGELMYRLRDHVEGRNPGPLCRE